MPSSLASSELSLASSELPLASSEILPVMQKNPLYQMTQMDMERVQKLEVEMLEKEMGRDTWWWWEQQVLRIDFGNFTVFSLQAPFVVVASHCVEVKD